ncbi:MAG: acetyl-CoA carboxylase, carboxyltransferase subunit beta [Planctomycetes bacterium]|nr:acetyl-CoA carboxylase, carboxyltransferase subunit beta [Planctomycetota bacterium]
MALAGRRTGPGEGNGRRTVRTEAQFLKCENSACNKTLFVKEVQKHNYCCPACGHHFRVSSRERVQITIDSGTWTELFDELEPMDVLNFQGKKSYQQSLKEGRQKSGEKEAVICGACKVKGIETVFCAMDFKYIGASMGSVVGEKIARAIEYATAKGWPIVIVCCSGGARMQEGVLSLMQMAKTSAALQRHNEAGLAYIAVLTDPTLAGVSASYAFLADVIVAEPKAMIGFTGARVLEQAIKVKLPPGFQESEFLLKHGQLDMVVPRAQIRSTLGKLLTYATAGGARKMQDAAKAPRSRLEFAKAPAQAAASVTGNGQAAPKKKAARRKPAAKKRAAKARAGR